MFAPINGMMYGIPGLLNQRSLLDDSSGGINTGLLGAAAGLLSMSGPSTTPTSIGQALGAGLHGYAHGRGDYYQFLPTTNGYMVGDTRRGTITSPGGATPGKPIIPAQFDPKLQGDIAGAKAGAGETAKDKAENRATLGSTLDEITKMKENITNLTSSPGFSTIYGLSGAIDPRNIIPGTDAANAQAMRDQLDAQSFGISIGRMRGMGALSDAEGKKVSAAYTRATNPKLSDTEAKKAWDEVIGYLDTAAARANERAGVTPPTAPGSVRRFNPRTGKIE